MIGCTDSLSFLNYCPAPSIFLHPAVGSHVPSRRASRGEVAFGVESWDSGDVPRSPPEAQCPRGQDCASLPRAIPAVSHGTAPTRCLAAALCSVAVSSSQLQEPLFSSEGNQYFSKFSALDPALDFCLASGEAGVFAKLLGCPAPYQGPFRGCLALCCTLFAHGVSLSICVLLSPPHKPLSFSLEFIAGMVPCHVLSKKPRYLVWLREVTPVWQGDAQFSPCSLPI